MTPKSGKAAIGIRAVAEIGIASVIQNVTIMRAIAAVRFASMDIPEGDGKNITRKNRKNPKDKPMIFLIE
jgi:hypothetical protein